jgi:hypothetical protein
MRPQFNNTSQAWRPLGLLALVLAFGPALPACGAPPPAVISGPTGGVPGDILWLDASTSVGDHFLWKVTPSAEGRLAFVVYPGDVRKCQIPSRPGSYTVFLAVSNDEGVDLTTWTVTVNGPAPPEPFPPQPVPPQPAPPAPVPPPNPPAPNPPAPAPNPDPFPVGQFNISRDVATWAMQIPSATRAAEAKALADAADSIAAAIAAGTVSGAQQILSAVFTANNTALGTNVVVWHPFGEKLSARIKAIYLDKKLTTDAAWATLFQEIAVGLRAVR